jgi:hypothetical protein
VERVASEMAVEQPSPQDWISLLSEEVGPRRPTSPAERRAAELIRARLAAANLRVETQEFQGFSTFAEPLGAIIAPALAASLVARRYRSLRAALALASAALLGAENDFRRMPISNLLRRHRSQNVVATIEPRSEARRTVCLVSHLDTSRSGFLFHPRFVRFLNPWLRLQAIACVAQSTEPLIGRSRIGRRLVAGARASLAITAALLAERELRGVDVPGANDNASGVAAVAQLTLETAETQLEHTRVVSLMTGCEEAGVLGIQAFLDRQDTSGWLFLNFDNVGGPATLRYLPREGVGRTWDADRLLLGLAERVSSNRPELGLTRADSPIGLSYDATPVLARGGRAITFVAADHGVIPNYHWPTDTTENLEPACVQNAIEVGREMLAALDRGEAG